LTGNKLSKSLFIVEQAASLAKRIIIEKDVLSNWHICSKELGLLPEVKLIQWMMK